MYEMRRKEKNSLIFNISERILKSESCIFYLNKYVGMSQETYFENYLEIIGEALKKIKKIGFKKISLINELMQTLTNYLAKEVYGRVEPANYLLLFILALGGKNSKLYPVVIETIQRIISNNYIQPNDDLSGSLRMLKDQHKELLLLPIEDYSRKTFEQVYIETLIALPDRTEQINLTICKNFTLIFRLSQNYLSPELVQKICDFMVESILINKWAEYDPILKSCFLEIVRHAMESFKEAYDHKLIEEDEDISVSKFCKRYGSVLADQVAIRLAVEEEHGVKDYQIIPKAVDSFSLLSFKVESQEGLPAGKFGWCVVCRKTANFYCRVERVPVCGFDCKQTNLQQNQQLDKFYAEECKSLDIYSSHIETMCRFFGSYLEHQDIRKREVFASIFLHLSSELRKISVKSMTPAIKEGIQSIFRECCYNIAVETEAFVDCLKSAKKLMPLKLFYPETVVLLTTLSKKLTHFITPPPIKVEILKFCGDLIKSEILFQVFMDLDCNPSRGDPVKELISSISSLYIGVKPPQGLSAMPQEDPQVKQLAYEALSLLAKHIKHVHRIVDSQTQKALEAVKREKNSIKDAIERFNKSEKPTKIIKKLVSEKFFPNDPERIALFLHKYLKRLSYVNVGVLIGDYDPLAIAIRDHYIGQLNFKGFLVDEGLRILLNHFTIPGESQVVERIIECFSISYYNQNKEIDKENIFHKSDAVYSFSYLLMMLQTNLHNPQVIDKMTLPQFSNLSKNMNHENSEFPADFLQKIYKSIEAKQLGFHLKHKEIEIIALYQQGQTKKAQEIYSVELEKDIKKDFEGMLAWDERRERCYDKFSVKLLVTEMFGDVINATNVKIRENESKQELLHCWESIDRMIKFSLGLEIESYVGHSIKGLWEQIIKTPNTSTIKKYLLYEKLLIWVRQYTLHIYDQWRTIISIFSSFHRIKSIKKDNSGKSNIIVVTNERCYLYDSFINSIMLKSAKFNNANLICLVEALIDSSKEEITENHTPFSLEKIGDVLESNTNRLTEILPLIWNRLKDHYTEIGCNKNEKVALFGTDFLKQLLTKFLKRKDLLFFQKEYLKPLQDIFNSNVALGVKEYIVGGLSYFVNNYFQNIKEGWKIILAILCDAFDEDEDQMVKEKSLGIVRKIYESNFLVMDIDENYVDFVQILGRMAREKEDVYPKSCIDAIQTITHFYQKKLGINVDNPSDPENEKFDIIFWQTMWLPLLSTIYGICGDFRFEIQNQAIECMFDILMRYGKLFKYQFWKMIMQGILRPTFEEITYTSQSKPLPKAALEDWLKTSFSLLFVSINKLICMYFNDFKLFLPDILKIYESCILSNSNKILTQLSVQALTDLLCNVGNLFEDMNWTEYIDFIDAVSRKGFPYEVASLQSWKKSQHDTLENSYQGKCLTMSLILINCQTVLEKFSGKLLQKNIEEILEILEKANEFCRQFNRNIQLREGLWKNGFFTEMKSLPGLVKHEHEALKAITICKFKLSQKSEVNIDAYAQHSLKLLEEYKKSLITEPPKQFNYQLEEQERLNTMLHMILVDSVFKHIEVIGLSKLVELGYRQFLLDHFLDCMAFKTFCSKCKFCGTCEASGEREKKFTEIVKNLIKELFKIKEIE